MINTREDWIKAGIDILEKQGIDNVKIELMARKMGITKGGFYGYFLNRDTFLQAMLDYWAELFTSRIMKIIEGLEGNLSEKLRKLLNLVDDRKYDALEISMFAWANKDPKAKTVVMRVVKDRLLFVTNLFLEGGFSRNEAANRAHLVHHYMSGCRCSRPLLPKYNSPKRQAQLDHIIRLVTETTTQK
jgi:AcrR family transcriptional regulator